MSEKKHAVNIANRKDFGKVHTRKESLPGDNPPWSTEKRRESYREGNGGGIFLPRGE
jgi:hypothetical protein